MGLGDFWLQFNNGKKHQLNDAQHGVRKEQVDFKFHNLFDLYDENKDGTLEAGELEGIFKGLSKYAGADKILNTSENMQAQSVFATQVNMQDVDFQGFVKSISDASEQIVSTKETPTPDGGKEIVTEYKDGSVETISYYPDGSYKFKKFDHNYTQTTTFYTIADDTNTKYTEAQIDAMVKKDYDKLQAEYKQKKADYNANKSHYIEFGVGAPIAPPKYDDFKKAYLQQHRINLGNETHNYERHDIELSDRAKFDVDVREFLVSHFIETHQGTQRAMDTMGILDDIGAAINAGAGELWNSCKNVYNKWFGNGTESDYQNFYELVKKFEPQYNQALIAKSDLGIMKDHPELFFRDFETDYIENTGNHFDLEKTVQFQHLTEQYQTATIFKQRIDLLKNALSEIDMYWAEQNALTYSPAQSEGLNPATHILKANKYLLAFFGDDQDAADMVLNGTIGNPDGTKAKIKELLQDAQNALENALLKRTTTLETDGFGSLSMNIATQGMEQYSYDELQTAYQSAYKEMYGVDFVPDELTEKVMGAKATGGMVKMAIITIISIIITRSPIMTEITGAAAGGAAIEGASANLIRTLVTKYGQTAVQQGIKFAMTTGTVATDLGLTLLNQVTSTRGVNGEELWESTKGAAKYIYFGAYVGGPIAQAVSQRLGQIGMTGRLLEGGTKATQGAIKTTTISGEKLLQNMAKGGSSLLAKGGAFATDVALFTGLEIATEGANPLEAFSEQGEMLGKLKIMNGFIEYLLGARTHTVMDRARWDVAIEKSGIKNWNIKEVQAPDTNGKGMKITYTVDVDGIPIGRFEDLNVLATAIMERVSSIYSENTRPQTRTQTTKPEGEVKATPENEVETETARPESRINIPAGKFEAPNAKFAETDEAFRSIVTKRSADIRELDKISDIDEFCRKSFELMKEEMGLEDSDIKLEITDKDNYYDHETNTVYISRNWAGKEKGHVKGKGDKAEIFGGMAHELNHYLQWKEIILNFDSGNPSWDKIKDYLQSFEGAQKNIEYIIEKYPDNMELKEFFEKAKLYQDNWLNYTDAFDESGKLKTGAEYDKYRNQTVEAESFRRGDIVAEEYRKTIAEKIKPNTKTTDYKAEFETKFLPVIAEGGLDKIVESFKQKYPDVDINEFYSLPIFEFASDKIQNESFLKHVIRFFDKYKNFPYDKYGKFIENDPKNWAYAEFKEGIDFSVIEKYDKYIDSSSVLQGLIYHLTPENIPLIDKCIENGIIDSKNIAKVALNIDENMINLINKYVKKGDIELFTKIAQQKITTKHLKFIEYFKKFINKDNIESVLKLDVTIPDDMSIIPNEIIGTVITKENFCNVNYNVLVEEYNEFKPLFNRIDWNKYRKYIGKIELNSKILRMMSENVDTKLLDKLCESFDIEYADFSCGLQPLLIRDDAFQNLPFKFKTEIFEALQRPETIQQAREKGSDYYKIFEELKTNLEKELLHSIDIVKVDDKYIDNFMKRLFSINELELETALENEHTRNKFDTDVVKAFPELSSVRDKNAEYYDVLSNIIKSNDYQKASYSDKMAMKLAAIFHGMDAKAAYALMKSKLNISDAVMKNVVNLLNIEELTDPKLMKTKFGSSAITDINPFIATVFNTPEKLQMAEIFGKATGRFLITDEQRTAIKDWQQKIYEHGIPLFSTRLPKGKNLDKIPVVEYNGKQYQVLNLTQIQGSLEPYGFGAGTTAENFSVNATFVRNVGEAKTIEVISNPSDYPYPSSTKIGIGQNGTFQQRIIGIPIEPTDMNDYILAMDRDVDAGHGAQTLVSASRAEYSSHEMTTPKRRQLSTYVKEKLGYTDEQYAQLYSQISGRLHSFNNIVSLTIDSRVLSPEEVRNVVKVLKDAQFEIVNKEEYKGTHNETKIVDGIINDKFLLAKVDDISEIPQEWLDYAEEKNLKFILIGSKQENTDAPSKQDGI